MISFIVITPAESLKYIASAISESIKLSYEWNDLYPNKNYNGIKTNLT